MEMILLALVTAASAIIIWKLGHRLLQYQTDGAERLRSSQDQPTGRLQQLLQEQGRNQKIQNDQQTQLSDLRAKLQYRGEELGRCRDETAKLRQEIENLRLHFEHKQQQQQEEHQSVLAQQQEEHQSALAQLQEAHQSVLVQQRALLEEKDDCAKEQEERLRQQAEQAEQLQQRLRSQEEQLHQLQVQQLAAEAQLSGERAEGEAAQRQHQEQSDKNQERIRRLERALSEKEKIVTNLQAQRDPLSFDRSNSIVKCPASCSNLAVTSEGRLLLALREHGLKELNASSGDVVSSWKPQPLDSKKEERVTTVDALYDGRIVVDLHYSRCIVLLRRNAADGDGWVESRRFDGLHAPPKQLAVHAELLAVAECKWDDFGKQWMPGRQLVLLRLCCGQELLRTKLEYDIQSVAVTTQTIVAASKGKVKLDDGKEAHVVDCYSHRGEKLWRHERFGEIWHVCASPSGEALYLANQNSDTLTAISGDTGKLLKDVVLCSLGQEKPARLAIRRARDVILAVLADDWNTVTVYSASSSHTDGRCSAVTCTE